MRFSALLLKWHGPPRPKSHTRGEKPNNSLEAAPGRSQASPYGGPSRRALPRRALRPLGRPCRSPLREQQTSTRGAPAAGGLRARLGAPRPAPRPLPSRTAPAGPLPWRGGSYSNGHGAAPAAAGRGGPGPATCALPAGGDGLPAVSPGRGPEGRSGGDCEQNNGPGGSLCASAACGAMSRAAVPPRCCTRLEKAEGPKEGKGEAVRNDGVQEASLAAVTLRGG